MFALARETAVRQRRPVTAGKPADKNPQGRDACDASRALHLFYREGQLCFAGSPARDATAKPSAEPGSSTRATQEKNPRIGVAEGVTHQIQPRNITRLPIVPSSL